MDPEPTLQQGFMSHDEMAQQFPGRRGLELVVLVEHDGEHMWKRERDGWYRLSDEVSGGV